MARRIRFLAFVVAALAAAVALPVHAQNKYGPGVTDTEIRIGQTMSYSGPLSAYASIGKAEAAYFQMVNDQGGINGRRIRFISLDDAFQPPRTVELTRRLVEQDEVLLTFGSLGTPTNIAVQKYLNDRKVPQLFVSTGATRFGDPKNFPWTMGWLPNFQSEARVHAKYLLKEKPDAKIAVLAQNDDFGRDYLKGLKDGLGERGAKMIVAEATYEVTDATVDSQVAMLKASGADTLITYATPKFAAQTIRKVADFGWKPLHLMSSVSSSIAQVYKPAGLENAKGLLVTQYIKDPTALQWQDDPGMKAWFAWMKRYNADADLTDVFPAYGYSVAQTLVHVLKQCGDDLSRENVMRQAASIKDLELPLLLPGIRVNTSATDYFPVGEMRLMRFDGEHYVPVSGVLSGRD
jgi:branched-chain amino acid transport system substrate-binding protein